MSDHHAGNDHFLMGISTTTAWGEHLHYRCLPFPSEAESDSQRGRGSRGTQRPQISGRPAHFCGSGDNLLFCQYLLSQLGTRVSHAKVARLQLLDLTGILLSSTLRVFTDSAVVQGRTHFHALLCL